MKAAFVLALMAAASAAPTSFESSAKTKVSLGRRARKNADGSANLDVFFRQIYTTVRKYNKDIELPAAVNNAAFNQKRQTGSEPLSDFSQGGEDELYYGVGTVGEVQQSFTFDFDTGSSDVFVPGPKCGSSQGCSGTTKYNQEGQDEGNTTSVTYGSGAVEGENYFDSVTVAGLQAEHQNIISLTQAQGFSGTASDALMGMGFQSIAASGQTPFFFSLLKEGKVGTPEFSFYLGREESGTGNDSELTLGGRDSSKYTGSFTAVPVTVPGYWQVAIDGMSVNGGSNLEDTAAQAAIDTGTTLVYAPTTAASSLYSNIPGSIPLPLIGGSTTYYAYPCDSTAVISLGFAGKSFSINPEDFNQGTISEDLGLPLPGYCLGGILGADLDPDTPLYVVGDEFLKSWYSTYTVGSGSDFSGSTVSFAQAV